MPKTFLCLFRSEVLVIFLFEFMSRKFDRSNRLKQQLNKRLKIIDQSHLISISTPFQYHGLSQDPIQKHSKIMVQDSQIEQSCSPENQTKQTLQLPSTIQTIDSDERKKGKAIFPFMLQKNLSELRRRIQLQNVKELGIAKKSLINRDLLLQNQKNDKAKSCSFRARQMKTISSNTLGKNKSVMSSTTYTQRMRINVKKLSLKPLNINAFSERMDERISPWNIYSPL